MAVNLSSAVLELEGIAWKLEHELIYREAAAVLVENIAERLYRAAEELRHGS